jgi:NAD(P)-dependent dehydrogenase (short-subunit alcohol dehydrogenase family)
MSNLTGRTALITGGSKGIGYGIAEALVRQGMNLVITARNQTEVEAAARALQATGPGKALGLPCDVRDLAAQESVVAQAVSNFGSVDVLVANAGVGHFGSISELTPAAWQETIDINLTGVFNSVKAALPQLERNQGYFISIASLAGTNFFAGGAAYNASKFGLVGFTQAAMLDLRNLGIKCTTIMPGSVASHFNDNEPGEKDAWKIQPQDIGEMVVYLLGVPARTLPSKIEVRPSRTSG